MKRFIEILKKTDATTVCGFIGGYILFGIIFHSLSIAILSGLICFSLILYSKTK